MGNKNWRVLCTERLCDYPPWCVVDRLRIIAPGWEEPKDFFVMHYPDWVNVIAITAEGEMVMEHQYRNGYGQTLVELPCGVMEKGEDPLRAAQRELMEETGYGGGEWHHIMSISPNPTACTNLNHCFLAIGVSKQGEQHLDPGEELEVELMTLDKVHRLLEADEIKQSLHAAPLWRFFAELKNKYAL